MRLKQLNIEIPEKDLIEIKKYALIRKMALKEAVIQAIALYLKHNRHNNEEENAL